jgi:hypothetical protein
MAGEDFEDALHLFGARILHAERDAAGRPFDAGDRQGAPEKIVEDAAGIAHGARQHVRGDLAPHGPVHAGIGRRRRPVRLRHTFGAERIGREQAETRRPGKIAPHTAGGGVEVDANQPVIDRRRIGAVKPVFTVEIRIRNFRQAGRHRRARVDGIGGYAWIAAVVAVGIDQPGNGYPGDVFARGNRQLKDVRDKADR